MHTDAIFRPLSTFRRRAQLLQAIWQTPIAVAILDAHGHVEQFNPAMESLLGYPSAAWKGAPFGYFAYPDEAQAFRSNVVELLGGSRRTAQMERRLRRRDGATARK